MKVTNFKPKLSDQTVPYEEGKLNAADAVEIVDSLNAAYDLIDALSARIAVLEGGQTDPDPTPQPGEHLVLTANTILSANLQLY